MADDEGRGPPSGRIIQPTFEIRNRNFMDDVAYLKEVRSFLLQQAVMVDASNDLGVLYSLKYSRGEGTRLTMDGSCSTMPHAFFIHS